MRNIARWWLAVVCCAMAAAPIGVSRADETGGAAKPTAGAISQEIVGPPGSEEFGYAVGALPNGNIIVTDPLYDRDGIADVGAIFLYDGDTRELISVVTGSQPEDYVGASSVYVLPSGNALVQSGYWSGGVGALTWINGTTGLTGTVSVANSIVGSSRGDSASPQIVILPNGNYVYGTPGWNKGSSVDFGAATWGDGTRGTAGVISADMSLIGQGPGDEIGSWIMPLANDNYLLLSTRWDNGGVQDAGAVTWGDGTRGTAGVVSEANSIVGSTAYDAVGRVLALTNGNYLVVSPDWDNGSLADAGAVTWGDGTRGTAGAISAANSLVGPTAGLKVGEGTVALANGNYVTVTPGWANAAGHPIGAVTWGDGTRGTAGPVAAANSLTGSRYNDLEAAKAVPLTNGNYVVGAPRWSSATNYHVGAATWADGTRPTVGVIEAASSLIGSTREDFVGGDLFAWRETIVPLANGNYVVGSPRWDNGGVQDVGAVTWGDGTRGTAGVVSAANSLVGTGETEYVGTWITPLTNGNYVVIEPAWRNSAGMRVGAATWGNGRGGTAGAISPANSLVGSNEGDVGGTDVIALANGHYVVPAPYWDNGGAEDVGAVTWGDGNRGVAGLVSPANSMIGSQAHDQVGEHVVPLTNGAYVIGSPRWDNGDVEDAGASTWVSGAAVAAGAVTPANSLVGAAAGELIGGTGEEGLYPNVKPEPGGAYWLDHGYWNDEKGAFSLAGPLGGLRGTVSADNSALGGRQYESRSFVDPSYDARSGRLVVGWWQRNKIDIVTLAPPAHTLYLPGLGR